MKYILTEEGFEIGRYKTFEKAAEAANRFYSGLVPSDVRIIEAVSEFQMSTVTEHKFKEKKF